VEEAPDSPEEEAESVALEEEESVALEEEESVALEEESVADDDSLPVEDASLLAAVDEASLPPEVAEASEPPELPPPVTPPRALETAPPAAEVIPPTTLGDVRILLCGGRMRGGELTQRASQAAGGLG
jgi:hypothetical protein